MAIRKAIISFIAELLKPSIGGISPLSYTSEILTCWSNCRLYAEILSITSLKDAWTFPANSTTEQIVKGSLTPVTFHLLALVLTAEATQTIHSLFYWTHICEDSNIV